MAYGKRYQVVQYQKRNGPSSRCSVGLLGSGLLWRKALQAARSHKSECPLQGRVILPDERMEY
ncbi:MAG: hypothetical protein SVY53_05250 [Chloroflexota bacterium]|nr:hypothetical protein [Chloroflexota bacterium]